MSLAARNSLRKPTLIKFFCKTMPQNKQCIRKLIGKAIAPHVPQTPPSAHQRCYPQRWWSRTYSTGPWSSSGRRSWHCISSPTSSTDNGAAGSWYEKMLPSPSGLLSIKIKQQHYYVHKDDHYNNARKAIFELIIFHVPTYLLSQ